MVRSTKQKINKETMALNDTLDQMDLTDIFRTFHPKAAEYTFFSNAHGTFSRIDHIRGHKSALNKYKKIEIILCIFQPQRCETQNQPQEKTWKNHEYLEITDILPKNEWVRGTWVAQSAECPTSAQVMISQFVG